MVLLESVSSMIERIKLVVLISSFQLKKKQRKNINKNTFSIDNNLLENLFAFILLLPNLSALSSYVSLNR